MLALCLSETEADFIYNLGFAHRKCWICEEFVGSLVCNENGWFIPASVFTDDGIISHLEQLLGRAIDLEAETAFIETHCDTNEIIEASGQEASAVSDYEAVYSLAHSVLIPNKFHIVHINFPATHDPASLNVNDSASTRLPDIIALPPKGITTFSSLIIASASSFVTPEDQDMTEVDFKLMLRRRLDGIAIEDENLKVGKIVFGTIVGSDSRNLWLPAHTDVLFRIDNRVDWSLGIFASELLGVFSQLKGKLKLPA